MEGRHTLDTRLMWLLRLACFCVCLGRAWQHALWDVPFRTILWDEMLMRPIIESLSSMSWEEYAGSSAVDQGIQRGKQWLALLYALGAILSLTAKRTWKWAKWGFYGIAILLAFLAALYMKEKFFHLGQFFEYSLQIGSPLLLAWALYQPMNVHKLWRNSLILIALTFACHGLYAIGFYPRPGHFVDMTIGILGVKEAAAHQILKLAGVLDLLLIIGIFWRGCSRYFLLYAIFWGFATAIARIWANVYWDFLSDSLLQWLPQMLYRLPHGLIPLFALILSQQIMLNSSKTVFFSAK